MAFHPPQPQYIPPAPPPTPAPPVQQPAGTPGQYATNAGAQSFMSNAAAAPLFGTTGKRSLLGT